MDYQTQENRDFIDHVQTSCLYAKPVIVLSSNKTDSEAGELLTEAQVYHCFTKPFNPLELVRCINELMKSAPVQIINKN
jgi:DNA-binding response OmpR family regulator